MGLRTRCVRGKASWIGAAKLLAFETGAQWRSLSLPYGRVPIPDRLAQLRTLPDFLNRRGDNRCPILRVTKLQVHSSTDKAPLQHGTSPSRACDGDHYGLRAVLGMP